MADIALITPTSDRPQAFGLCERWMRRALPHVRERVEWYVIDDGREPVCCTMGQIHLRRRHAADTKASFTGNLVHGLKQVRADKILFIEDDDWYDERYLAVMSSRLDKADIAGESRAKYYNVHTRHYRTLPNRLHASLCQTAIHGDLARWIIRRLEQVSRTTFIDIHLWRTGAQGKKQFLSGESIHCVGIKGLPGKRGIGVGHRSGGLRNVDHDAAILSKWVGATDAEIYKQFFAQKG